MSNEPVQPIACRKCDAEVPVGVKFCPQCGAAQQFDRIPIVFIFLLACSSVLLMSSSYVTVTKSGNVNPNTKVAVAPPPPAKPAEDPAPSDLSESAYLSARHFISELHPNTTKISSLKESPVQKEGTLYTVTLLYEGTDNGSAVRNMSRVRLNWEKGKWKLVGVE